MASNSRTLADEDGSFEDWIEIHNFSSTNVNLYGWGLTDTASKPHKWTFPALNLPPGGFLIVFASNKDRHSPDQPLHTNFKLDAGGEYLALVDPSTNILTRFFPTYPAQVSDVSFGFGLTASNLTLVAAGAPAKVLIPSVPNGGSALNFSWTGSETNEPFNTGSWTTGATGIGFGVAATNISMDVQSSLSNNNASAFIRLQFNVANPTNFSLLTLRLKYDDGFVAWLNGNELARANAPSEDLSWNSTATAAHSNLASESISVGAGQYLKSGVNVLALQGLNLTVTNDSFLILPELLGATYAAENTNGLYFTQPTPGADNFGGAAVPGPGIADVAHCSIVFYLKRPNRHTPGARDGSLADNFQTNEIGGTPLRRFPAPDRTSPHLTTPARKKIFPRKA
ncbi:MAG: lamin tail domain-containing protein [Akkermansiaceae bacterium]|nr:lamin tail domain-containing protein [Verrucomicrobiales bacterium]